LVRACVHRVGPVWTGTGAGLLVVGTVAWDRSRRWVLAGLGCLVTRYRLRTALRELRLSARSGRLPGVLWMCPTPVGERVWLICPVGVSAEDIADETDRIRAACYARDVRVVRDPRWSALVTVEVIRRDPLASTAAIRTPLVDVLGSVPLPRQEVRADG
ncbi:MAG TPA: hypothetical protein VIS06_20525, partial [Mycobacteriales bacterium]